MSVIQAIKGDITSLEVHAIVNAANTTLLGGGGVDGAIHRAAGPELLEECKGLNGCETGEAKITSGYNLRAQFVIHTPGPVWKGGENNEEYLLASCYKNCMEIAQRRELASIAFPCISTGVYNFPPERASQIAFAAVKSYVDRNELFESVIFCCFSDQDLDYYQKLIG